ncbi:2-dehydro-3-deoxygluconokinase [Carnobacterium sp. 17-4]|uniref:sugar kinase n=1 Tax=Carnobacterium sp. (strain 17-4) TaxID=208596 RepID=UPI0002058D1C|nr:sugar kinase [Carnobacterium sp. 17-4]AEB30749.1 2-dehydro-3-deoxygluconokinase [Carnobacterium sp. 17-4]
MKKDVVLIGEAMGLFSADESGKLDDALYFSKKVAGAEVNVSIGLSRLGMDVELLTRLGQDYFGRYILKFLESEGIGTEFISFDEDSNTGFMLKSKTDEGDPETAYYRKGSAFSELSIEDLIGVIDFTQVKVLHITGIPSGVSRSVRSVIYYLMSKAKEAGTFITFDPNLRPALWESEEIMKKVLNELATYADVILPGISEAKILTGLDDPDEIADFYFEKGVKYIVLKMGASGAYVKGVGKEKIFVPGFKVEKVVDTVGAGDGFAVGIISGYLDGLTVEESAIRANAIGSIQVQNLGDNEGLPNRETLLNYIAENSLIS